MKICRIANHMRGTTALLGLFGIASVAAGLPLSAQTGDASSAAVAETAEVPLDEVQIDRDRYERLTVPVTIAGRGPYRFFIDTGAQATVVTEKIIGDLKLVPSGRATLVAMGSSQLVETIEIDDLQFADRTFSGLISPLLQRQHVGADGILGLDSLQDLRVLIDFEQDQMTVADAADLGGNSGYEIVVRARAKLGQMIITDARINGVKTAVIIDTGAQNSLGNFELHRRLRTRAKDTLVTTDVHGASILSNMAVAKSLTIGDMVLTNVPIGFADSPAIAALGFTDQPALILGMGNLRLFDRVAIDFASRRVLFDLPDSVTSRDLVRQGFSEATRINNKL